jgi:4-aminobutyrate aminotransferase-like enzyme
MTGLFSAAVASELFKKHNILIYSGGKEDYLPVNPALIVKRGEIDCFIKAMDDVLSRNIFNLAMKLTLNVV